MKRNTRKALSILLAAVLLVAALPITAFAEDVSPCGIRPCDHDYVDEYWCDYEYISNDYHLVVEYHSQYCSFCGELFYAEPTESWPSGHTIDDSVDPEVDMSGDCIDCGGTIYW